jgi:IS30 family transposase
MRTAKVGRDHSAFLKYAASEPFLLFTELDTVEGSKRDQDKTRLLTFIFVKVRLFFSVLIPDGLSASVARVFDALYEKLGLDDFKFMFGTLLTDNGSEFSNPERIEFSPSGERRSWVFYCNPYASWEKGAIEVCHELFRRIIPKGSSLKDLDDDKVCLINSHINSYIRESNGSMSAYDTFANAFPERAVRILNLLKIQRIDPQKVILHPSLVKNL